VRIKKWGIPEDDNHRRLCIRYDHQGLPYHEGAAHDHAEVETLQEQLAEAHLPDLINCVRNYVHLYYNSLLMSVELRIKIEKLHVASATRRDETLTFRFLFQRSRCFSAFYPLYRGKILA
jgi:hypothetical protein